MMLLFTLLPKVQTVKRYATFWGFFEKEAQRFSVVYVHVHEREVSAEVVQFFDVCLFDVCCATLHGL